jgi:hypothetical protein
MQIKVIRKENHGDTIIGEMYIDNKFFCYTLEDRDNGWVKEDGAAIIMETKVYKNNCIPSGAYKIILSYSVKLKRFLPLILDVPAYKGIRIHKGTSKDWTSGCVLVSKRRHKTNPKKLDLGVTASTENELVKILTKANYTEPLSIIIERSYNEL